MLGKAATALLDMIAPFACIECAQASATPRAPLCRECAGRLGWWRRSDGCPRCGLARSPQTRSRLEFEAARHEWDPACPGCYSEGSALHTCRSLVRYEGPVKNWIPGFKRLHTFSGPPLRFRLAIEFLADELSHQLAGKERRAESPPPNLIIPIPLHRRRRSQRGFNQSDAIARRIAKELDCPLATDILRRRKDTTPQAALPHRDRRQNLRSGFVARRSLRGARRVWLVDDVLTTGATLEAAAEACLAAGAEQVHGVTLAATPPSRSPF